MSQASRKKSGKKLAGKRNVKFVCEECALLQEKNLLTERLLQERDVKLEQVKQCHSDEVNLLRCQLSDLQARYDQLCDLVDNNKLEPMEQDEVAVADHAGVVRMLRRMIQAAHHPPTTESRLEELETRLTHLSSQLVACTGQRTEYENFLLDAHRNRPDIDQLHSQIADLFISTGKVLRDAYCDTDRSFIDDKSDLSVMKDGYEMSLSLGTLAAYPEKEQQILLKPPLTRLSGSTPLARMNRDLRRFLCSQLDKVHSRSLSARRAGGDWRVLATRLGFDPSEFEGASPTHKLFTEWSKSEAATVRLLHRHLSVPQMQCPLLARRIQDFYTVE